MSLPSVREALAIVLDAATPVDDEHIGIADADGRVLAHDARAAWDLPNADVSIMDGWAVRAIDVAQARSCGNEIALQVRGESAAGHPSPAALEHGVAARISTGAVLPEGADAVIAQEDTRREGERLVIDPHEATVVVPGRFVRARGSEVQARELILAAGHRLEPGDIGLLAAAGCCGVRVHRRPRVAILGTGDELVPIGRAPAPGQVVSVDSLVLALHARRAGAIDWILPDVRDEPAALAAALGEALAADLVVTAGGISVGDHDHVADVLAGLGVQLSVRGVALRPGKPTSFGSVADTGALVFALPGNPASALVAFELLVRPAILRRAGVRGPVTRTRRRVTLRSAFAGAGRREHFVRARLVGEDQVEALPRQLSGDLRSISDFDALVCVPAGVGDLPAGSSAEAIVLRELDPREREA